MISDKAILGKGPAYPFERYAGGSFKLAQGPALVKMSLIQALRTPRGSRPMRKDLGSRLSNLLFGLEGEMRDAVALEFISEDLEDFEPRVEILSATVINNDNEISITVEYQDIVNNVEGNAVVPYYKGEL